MMDNHFVPNLPIGLPVVEALLRVTTIPIDCHLMIDDPDRWAPMYAAAVEASVTLHAEAAADRGIDARVGAAGWETICKAMEIDFRDGNFAGGVIKGIDAVSRHLAAHFPKHGAGPNELPDAPVVM